MDRPLVLNSCQVGSLYARRPRGQTPGTKHTGSCQVGCLCARRPRGQIPGTKHTGSCQGEGGLCARRPRRHSLDRPLEVNILAAVRWGACVQGAEEGRSATCSAMRISATCATRKFAADVRFNPQAADCGIAPAH